ncbi:hypothetical protein PILCRDRAFT_15737 [Piloderma croceum F 1598]|uniref:Uncharacterized protein n=1 Tax=Piloderma croceum (strain F 1598) TaxID=765440 RepID=A0A0C3AGA7_PILCF|nr:hypothetical protein PILCRDRAFT_15737 [Piloderma croceum F 1598]
MTRDVSTPDNADHGGSAVFKERPKGSLIVKIYVDGRKLFKKCTRDNDLTVQWELNSPIILKDGSRLAIKLTERKSYHRLISSRPGELKELKLNDDPTAIISVLAQCPDTLQEILDDTVKVSEQTKAVLDRLGRAKRFLRTIMELGAIACEVHPIANAVFGCVNIVYEKLQNEEQCSQLVLDLAKDMAYTLGYIEDVKQFARLAQLKQAIKDVAPLMEDTINFIVEFTFDGQKSANDDKSLEKLEPQGLVRGRPTAECMDGTREDILAKIDEWCDDLDTFRNILWINGFPGVGQSAIARRLATRLKSLHRFVVILLPTRLEDDISRALSAIGHRVELGSGDNISLSSSRDIHSFLCREFARIANNYPGSLSPVWPGAEAIKSFTKLSAGVFIYADTLIKFVDEGQPEEQLASILSESLHHGSLTQLYRQILGVSFKDPSTMVLEAFRNVTGTIILAKIPLRRQDIVHLLNVKPVALDHICQGLRSVLNTSDTGDLLRFTHQSFVDFLMDSGGCHPSFLFHNPVQSRILLLGSLRVMKNELGFNICKLETSHAIHDDIPDLKMRVHDNISVHLQYACLFWTDHVHKCDFDVQIAQEVECFMTNQFLYWLEVMSLLRKVNRVTQGLASVIAWSKVSLCCAAYM